MHMKLDKTPRVSWWFPARTVLYNHPVNLF